MNAPVSFFETKDSRYDASERVLTARFPLQVFCIDRSVKNPSRGI